MIPQVASVVQPVPVFYCASCRQGAVHNEVLHISFCPVHGLASKLNPTSRDWRWG